jgi:hypothetical protein
MNQSKQKFSTRASQMAYYQLASLMQNRANLVDYFPTDHEGLCCLNVSNVYGSPVGRIAFTSYSDAILARDKATYKKKDISP